MDAYNPLLSGAFEPERWNLVFHEKTKIRWLRWVGRFKHVSAFTYIPGARMWVVYDLQISGIRLFFYSHDQWIGGGSFAEWVADAEIVVFERRHNERSRIASRFFFSCVPAMKELIGVCGSALLPDAFYREVLKAGGQPIRRS